MSDKNGFLADLNFRSKGGSSMKKVSVRISDNELSIINSSGIGISGYIRYAIRYSVVEQPTINPQKVLALIEEMELLADKHREIDFDPLRKVVKKLWQ